jgi:hypothetical protein
MSVVEKGTSISRAQIQRAGEENKLNYLDLQNVRKWDCRIINLRNPNNLKLFPYSCFNSSTAN